ncbi:hypothetical protein ACLKA6_007774 [Drosophila palustris]
MEDILTISSCCRGIEFSVPKSFDWRTHVLPNLNEDRFLQMLRVTKMQFQTIVEFVRNDSGFKSSLFRPQMSVEQQAVIVLFRLGSSGEAAAIRKIATLFGVGDGGTIGSITDRVFSAILRKLSQLIYWPNAAERKKLALETIHELPYCIGYIDGSEIKLARTPQLDHEFEDLTVIVMLNEPYGILLTMWLLFQKKQLQPLCLISPEQFHQEVV